MTQQTAQTLGQLLLQARLDSGKSLQELHEATLVSIRYLTALEQNDFDELPSAAYIKGYVRRIAEVLGTSAEPLIAAYDARLGPVQTTILLPPTAAPAASAEETSCNPSSGRNYLIDLVRLTQHLFGYLWSDIFPWLRERLPAKRLMLILLVLLIAVLSYRLWPVAEVKTTDVVIIPVANVAEPEPDVIEDITPELLEETAPIEVAVAPAATTPKPAVVKASGPDLIEMDFYGPSVIRVKDANGNTIASGLKRAGESVRAKGKQPFKIQVGNPSVTDVRVNGIVVQSTPL